ncbi:MAG TPA: hypothetical protein VK338_06620 [Candidatus Nitrosocosmicus sp.]|nr:hypothetical protein [Candidatus Nitrosocosmicus sp.]
MISFTEFKLVLDIGSKQLDELYPTIQNYFQGIWNVQLDTSTETLVFTPLCPDSINFPLAGRVGVCLQCNRAQTASHYEPSAREGVFNRKKGYWINCCDNSCPKGLVFISISTSPTAGYVNTLMKNEGCKSSIEEIVNSWTPSN